jgi:hypothetical protein
VLRPGLSFRETMHGTLWRLDAPIRESAVDVTLEVRSDDLRVLARDRTLQLRGTIDVEGLATNATVEGTLGFKLAPERRLPYRIRFQSDDGESYELSGQKEWLPVAPIASITTLPASLYDASGQEVARATLRFDVRVEGWHLLRSFRLHLLG